MFSSSGIRVQRGGGAYLDDKGLVLEARTHPQLAHVSRLIDEVLNAVEHAAARCRDSTVDSSLADGFASDAGVSVDVLKRTKQIETNVTFYFSGSNKNKIKSKQTIFQPT